MRFWHLDYPAAGVLLDLRLATSLVAAIDRADSTSFAAEVLRTLGEAPGISQCTIFAYEFGNRPRTVSVADHRGGRFLYDVADVYAKLFYALDGNQQIISAPSSSRREAEVVMHRQTTDDIVHAGYRATCYSKPNVCDRLSILVQPARSIWLAVNLYRDRDQARFQAGEIAMVEALAPLIGHAARHHYALHGQRQPGIPQLMLARLLGICPVLTKREMDVLRGVLEGRTAAGIADAMGIQPASVVTYQKRAYRRLGISNQRQLFALLLSAEDA